MEAFSYSLPAIRGIQARREYYVAMCPLNLVPRLFPLDPEGVRPELRLQRALNKSRIPEIARYLTAHPNSYVLTALTASINKQVRFEQTQSEKGTELAGYLRIPLDAQLLLHDGLHRRAAIERVLNTRPELGKETIALVLYVDPAWKHAEQMFTDLKRNESHSARSRSIVSDHRDEMARLVRALISQVDAFRDMTETARSTISNRSSKLFTFTGIYYATSLLLSVARDKSFGDKLALARSFWLEVAKRIPDWERAKNRELNPGALRKHFVHAHAIGLAGIARAGKSLVQGYPKSWHRRLRKLATMDWSRSNTKLWEGRAMIAGRLSKARSCVVLTGNAVKRQLGIPLSAEEQDLERRANAAKGP